MYRKDWRDLPEGLAEEARGWVAQGFRILKMKIGYGPDQDVEAVRAVRDAIGDGIGLAVDANCAYDAAPRSRWAAGSRSSICCGGRSRSGPTTWRATTACGGR